jgi:hypothetical protein
MENIAACSHGIIGWPYRDKKQGKPQILRSKEKTFFCLLAAKIFNNVIALTFIILYCSTLFWPTFKTTFVKITQSIFSHIPLSENRFCHSWFFPCLLKKNFKKRLKGLVKKISFLCGVLLYYCIVRIFLSPYSNQKNNFRLWFATY